MNWITVLDTAALAAVVAACVVHYAANLDRHSSHCERWGFVLTGAGAFGEAVYHWTTMIEPFDFGLMMHAGMALIAAALVRGRVRALIAKWPGMKWAERRARHEQY